MTKTIVLLSVVLLLAVSCQSAPTPTPLPIATATLVPPTVTATLPPTIVPTRTATPRPTGNLVTDLSFPDPSGETCQPKSYPFGEYYCQDGEFHLINKGTGSIAASTGGNLANFIIQAQMRLVGESGSYGVAFRGQQNPSSYYIFRLRPGGQFQLITWSQSQSQNRTLIPWTDSPAILKGQTRNQIQVIAEGTQITLFVNDKQLASVTDASFAKGSVGPVATEQGHAVVSTFQVWELPGSAIPTPTAVVQPTPTPKPLLLDEREHLFDLVWTLVRDRYFDPTFNGLDWQAVRAEYEPRVAAASTSDTVYALIKEMLDRFGTEGPSFSTPQEVLQNNSSSYSGIGLRHVPTPEGGVILRLVRGGPAESAGLKPGEIVKAINGIDFNNTSAFGPDGPTGAVRGPAGTAVELTVQSPDGKTRSVKIIREPVSNADLIATQTLVLPGTQVGYVNIISFSAPNLRDQIKQLSQSGATDGLIIDLRAAQPTGATSAMQTALSWFNDGGSIGKQGYRNLVSMELNIVRGATLPEFNSVPIVVLVDRTTNSGLAEMFAAGMQLLKRARIVGMPTSGTTTLGSTQKLFDGSQLWLPDSVYKLPDGTRLQGRDLKADRQVDAKWYLFSMNDDPQVKAALEELRKK